MEEKFNNLENMEIEGETPPEKRSRKNYIIFGLIGIIVIAAIVVILYFVLRNDSNENKENQGNQEDHKDQEDHEKKDDNTCIIGEEDKCLTCDKDKCGSCNYKYRLVDGKCIAEFSFRAIYKTTIENQNISLMNDIYEENIISMEIDKENINSISANYTFPSSGYHTVYVSFNTESISSLDLFNNTENLIEIYFSKDKKYNIFGRLF